MRQESELLNQTKEYGWFKERLIRQYLLWSAVYIMITRNVNYSKAISTVDAEYYQKCVNTGEANILYRPADPMTIEIGPQMRIQQGFDWWLVILLAIVMRWLYKTLKK
jgi:hypothetical protein